VQGVTLHPLPPKSAGGRLGRMLLHAWRCFRIAKSLRADIYHFHDAELIPYGIWLAMTGKRVVYDAHEDLPRDIMDKEWIPRWARGLVAGTFGALEHFSVKRFLSVITATPHIENRFKRFNSMATAINNYPLVAELAPGANRHVRLRQICYVGGISRIRGIQPLIEALPKVPDIRLVLCGEFAEADFEAEVKSLPGWAQVDYRGQVARAGLQQIMGESLAGVVTFLPLPNHVDAQPNKMFEYMSAELPVIASDFQLWRQIIDGANAGLCVDPESPDAIAAAIRQLADHPALVEQMGKAGRHAVLTRYNWPTEAEKLIRYYKGLL